MYTGNDTKIMRNSEPPKQKVSDIERTMNKYILGFLKYYIYWYIIIHTIHFKAILVLQLGFSFFTSILNYAWNCEKLNDQWYLKDSHSGYNNELIATLTFFTYFLLYNTMIPISLIVSLEMVKIVQGYFI